MKNIRGAVRIKNATLVTVWIPEQLKTSLGRAVQITDTDRSKFVRHAIREKLEREGLLETAQ